MIIFNSFNLATIFAVLLSVISLRLLYCKMRDFFSDSRTSETIPSDKLKTILSKESQFVINELNLWLNASDNRVVTKDVLNTIKYKEYKAQENEIVQINIAKKAEILRLHREKQMALLEQLKTKE